MADNTHRAQMEERMQSLQASQAAQQETSEQHGALLAEELQRLDELRASQRDQKVSSGHSRRPCGTFFWQQWWDSHPHDEAGVPAV